VGGVERCFDVALHAFVDPRDLGRSFGSEKPGADGAGRGWKGGGEGTSVIVSVEGCRLVE